jgi:hypothetical protein
MSCEVPHCGGPADVLLPTLTFPVALCWAHADWVLPDKRQVLKKAQEGEQADYAHAVST